MNQQLILNNILQVYQKDELLYTGNERALLIPTKGFGILQRDLIKNIGIDRMKSFYFNYGWSLGEEDAKNVIDNPSLSIKEKILYAPQYHAAQGHVKPEIFEQHLEFDDNGKVISFRYKGKWEKSYEAEQHIHHLGYSNSPVCYTLTGYASGNVSFLLGEKVLIKEIQCEGQGAPCCLWEGRLLSDWEQGDEEQLFYYKEFPIIKELEQTNEKLMIEKNNLSMVTKLHMDLSAEIIKGNNLNTILEIVNKRIQKPVVAEDVHHQIQSIAGFTPEFYTPLQNDFINYIKNNSAITKTIVIHSEDVTRLASPIFLQDKLVGYCSFFYKGSKIMPNEIDFMIIGRVASICSMFLFHEKAKLESVERIKGHFLEEIINGQSRQDIMKKAIFLQLNLSGNYYAIFLQYALRNLAQQNELTLHEQIFENVSTYFLEKNINLLIGQRHDSLLILLPVNQLDNKKLEHIISGLLSYMRRKVRNSQVLAGISSKYSNIVDAKEAFEEARTAVRLSTKEAPVTTFHELGILGILINVDNKPAIRKIIKMTLGCLYENINPSKIELIETLYNFLVNGGNLEQTAQNLALSISGLRYRLNKITNLLGCELRDPELQFQLLLSIKALKIVEPKWNEV